MVGIFQFTRGKKSQDAQQIVCILGKMYEGHIPKGIERVNNT